MYVERSDLVDDAYVGLIADNGTPRAPGRDTARASGEANDGQTRGETVTRMVGAGRSAGCKGSVRKSNATRPDPIITALRSYRRLLDARRLVGLSFARVSPGAPATPPSPWLSSSLRSWCSDSTTEAPLVLLKATLPQVTESRPNATSFLISPAAMAPRRRSALIPLPVRCQRSRLHRVHTGRQFSAERTPPLPRWTRDPPPSGHSCARANRGN